MDYFNGSYKGKRVFITGHTGFKGSWLSLWMKNLGAIVAGYSLASSTDPNHISLLELEMQSTIGDIRDKAGLRKAIEEFSPDIVFHLAAQPLVRYSYAEPSETYETNVLGTLNVLEACRTTPSVKAVLCVTTDKVYENKESKEGYVETDRLSGYDPYSASKACAEILISSYVNSYLHKDNYGKTHSILVATARGGNVIGGGDWSEDRLIPDIIRAKESNKTLTIRNPKSVRPWQHVLDCLSGYIQLGDKLICGQQEFAGNWNFGPIDDQVISVEEIIGIAKDNLKDLNVEYTSTDLHETSMLRLNCDKAVHQLNWFPILDNREMFSLSFNWYEAYYDSRNIISQVQLSQYCELATLRKVPWIPC